MSDPDYPIPFQGLIGGLVALVDTDDGHRQVADSVLVNFDTQHFPESYVYCYTCIPR